GIILDGGNSCFKDDVRRARALQGKGIHYVDVGTSGGIWGAERGYCLMIGGPEPVVQHLAPIFRTLAPGRGDIAPTPGRERLRGTAEDGYLHCGPDSGEGRWTIMAALEEAVPADVLSASLYTRFRSRQAHTFAEKVLSAMRYKFGGHIERPTGG